MIKPCRSPPPYASTEPGHTVDPVSPQSNVKVSPTPSDSLLYANSQQEVEWQTSLQSLEHRMISYQHNAREGEGATEQDAERVAKAMDHVAHSHPDPNVKVHWKRNAKNFRKADPKEREGILEGILKSFLIILTSPFYVVAATLHATGLFVEGIGFVIKGVGLLAKKLTYTGSSFSKRSSASVDTTPHTK